MSAEILHFFDVIEAPNRIRELRVERKLSQQALGDRVGVSKVTISDLERGKMRLDLEYMRRIAFALDVSVVDLVPRKDNAFTLSAAERDLIEQLRRADPEQREQIRKVAEVIAPPKVEEGQEKAA